MGAVRLQQPLLWLPDVAEPEGAGRGKVRGRHRAVHPPLPAGTPKDVFFLASFTGEVTMVIPSHKAVVVSLGTSAAVGTMVAPSVYEGLCRSNVFGDNCPKTKVDEPAVIV